MKKLIILSILTFCFAQPELPAQRYLPGQRGLQITTGGVNALHRKTGTHWGVAFSTYTKHADRWVFGAEYLEKKHLYKNEKIPQAQFSLDAGYYRKFLSDARKTFFCSIGASAVAGYETVNWDEKLLFDGATILNKDAFLWGAALTLELETCISDRIVLLANVRQRLLSGSSVGKLNTQFGIGVKFIIN